MGALENARAALEVHDADNWGFDAQTTAPRLAVALRALIAEHERLTAPPTEAQVEAAYEAFVAGPEYARESIRAALEAARQAS